MRFWFSHVVLCLCVQYLPPVHSTGVAYVPHFFFSSVKTGETIFICVSLKCSSLHCLSFVWQTFQYIHLLTESWQPELPIFCAALFNWHELVSLQKIWHSHKLGSIQSLLHLPQLSTSEQVDLSIFEQRSTKNLGKEELDVVELCFAINYRRAHVGSTLCNLLP